MDDDLIQLELSATKTALRSVVRFFQPEPHPINANEPNNFHATHIIYRKLDHNDYWGYYYIERHRPMPLPTQAGWSIEQYVRDIALAGVDPFPQDEIEDGQILGIPNHNHSYVILELTENRRFDSVKPAIELATYVPDQATADSLYGMLRYVDPATGDSSKNYVPDCRLVYFRAVNRSMNGYLQPLNFNIVDRNNTPSTVDPDIRYPGNGGNP